MRYLLAAPLLLALLFGLAYWLAPAGQVAATAAHKAPPAPEFAAGTKWLQSPALKMSALKGKVVVAHFWTNGCINCIHNYPHYRAWLERYKGEKGLVIVGIHTPEFDAEKDVERIKDRARKNGLTFPIAVDNDGANWRAWRNEYWPAIYLVGRDGRTRQRWEGELGAAGYRKVTAAIDALLAEKPPR